jgi:hypothetical protein
MMKGGEGEKGAFREGDEKNGLGRSLSSFFARVLPSASPADCRIELALEPTPAAPVFPSAREEAAEALADEPTSAIFLIVCSVCPKRTRV